MHAEGLSIPSQPAMLATLHTASVREVSSTSSQEGLLSRVGHPMCENILHMKGKDLTWTENTLSA